MIRFFAAVRGLVYASGFVLFWWWIVRWARSFDTRLGFSIPESMKISGLILIYAGAILAMSCVLAFALVGKGTPAPFDAPRKFVATGPYRFVRNPMYIGALSVIIGASLTMRSPAALLVAFAFIALAHLFVLIYEEPTLERKFGESYRRYKREVNRWLPRPKGYSRQD